MNEIIIWIVLATLGILGFLAWQDNNKPPKARGFSMNGQQIVAAATGVALLVFILLGFTAGWALASMAIFVMPFIVLALWWHGR